jgi:MFS family permease
LTTPSVTRVVVVSFIGTTIEWYDFFLYGTAAALVFSQLFLPTFDPLAGTMAALATYSVGFFARRVGGVVVRHFSNQLGRKSMLVTTLMMMGWPRFSSAFFPPTPRWAWPRPCCWFCFGSSRGSALAVSAAPRCPWR